MKYNEIKVKIPLSPQKRGCNALIIGNLQSLF